MKIQSKNHSVNFSAAIAPNLNRNFTPKHIPAAGPFFSFVPREGKKVTSLLKTLKSIFSKAFQK